MEESALLALCHDLIDRARKAGADQAEAIATWSQSVDTNLENGKVHTVQTTDETVFGLRVFAGGSLGFATANGVAPDILDTAVGDAIAQARVMPADPLNDLPAAAEAPAVAGLYDAHITEVGVEETTRVAAALVERVRARDERVRIDSGAVSASTAASAIASTQGIALSESGTAIDGYLFGMAVDGDDVASFDYDGDTTRTWAEHGPLLEQAADRFVDKCLSGLGARKGRSFKGAVVLSPEAVGEFLLPNLLAALAADAVRKGRSALAGKLGQPIAASGFTVVDDGSRPGGIASTAFDREGVPVARRVLIDHGVLDTYLYNHYEARAAGDGTVSTGHASGSASTLPAIGPTFLEIAAGDTPERDLAAGDGPCLVVGRFSGSSNPVTGDFSGVAKNGFLIDGTMRQPVKETLIAGNLFVLLEHIAALSVERRLLGGSRLLPAIRAEGVSVTAG